MKFKSKVDKWIYLVLFPILALSLITIVKGADHLSVVVSLTVSILLIHSFFTTVYTLTDTALLVKGGIFYNLVIPYRDIISFKESNNIMASPAWSLDRIEIRYGGKFGKIIIISPERKIEFMNNLQENIRAASNL